MLQASIWQHFCSAESGRPGFQKNSPLAYFVFIPRSTYKFLKMQTCTGQVPHLHTMENVSTFSWMRALSLALGFFSLQSWEAAVWLPQLKTLIKESDNPSSPGRSPRVCLPVLSGRRAKPYASSSQAVSAWLYSPDAPKANLATANAAPACRDQPPSYFSSQGSPTDRHINFGGKRELKNRGRLS